MTRCSFMVRTSLSKSSAIRPGSARGFRFRTGIRCACGRLRSGRGQSRFAAVERRLRRTWLISAGGRNGAAFRRRRNVFGGLGGGRGRASKRHATARCYCRKEMRSRSRSPASAICSPGCSWSMVILCAVRRPGTGLRGRRSGGSSDDYLNHRGPFWRYLSTAGP